MAIVNIYPHLENVKSILTDLSIFKSVKIGLEKGADKAVNTPFARIVVETIEHKGALSDAVIQIIIGLNTKNNYEELYKEFFNTDYIIKNALFQLPCKVEILNSITDEDRLINLKAGIIRFKLKGLIDDN